MINKRPPKPPKAPPLRIVYEGVRIVNPVPEPSPLEDMIPKRKMKSGFIHSLYRLVMKLFGSKVDIDQPISSFDCDGVIFIKKDIGVYPGPNDIIVTGRSFEEKHETEAMLKKRGIKNPVFFNPLEYDLKTRISSGEHKARTLNALIAGGVTIKCHYEDDLIQADIINRLCPEVPVVLLLHDMTEKENKRQLDY
jgi:hypothetical protein